MGLFKSKKKKEQEQNLITMQNFLFSLNSTRLVKTPNQILTRAGSYVNERKGKIGSAANIINVTDNPTKFFDALDKIELNVKEIEYLEQLAPSILSGSEGAKQIIYRDLPNDIDTMIDKCWETHRLQALKVVKEETKKKKLSNFFELMDIYKNRMYPQNLEHLEKLKAEFENIV